MISWNDKMLAVIKMDNSVKKINGYIDHLASTSEPLSADVYIIRGNDNNYIFDVGANKISRDLINSINNKIIIISHFHQDHLGNMVYIKDGIKDLYIGDYTYHILGYGNKCQNMIEINDGINLKIIPLPNSHSKGSLILIVNDEYLFVGDALYSNRNGYNVSLLNEEIRILKELKYDKVLVSHENNIYSKEEILMELEYFYSKRDKNKPNISFSDLK